MENPTVYLILVSSIQGTSSYSTNFYETHGTMPYMEDKPVLFNASAVKCARQQKGLTVTVISRS